MWRKWLARERLCLAELQCIPLMPHVTVLLYFSLRQVNDSIQASCSDATTESHPLPFILLAGLQGLANLFKTGSSHQHPYFNKCSQQSCPGVPYKALVVSSP